MTADHATSQRVYEALKRDLLTDRFGRGRLHVAPLQARYAASATPVREALLRLVGERLVDLRSSGGFALPAMSLNDARDLYDLSLSFSLLAARWPADAMAPYPDTRQGKADMPIDRFFASLAHHTRNSLFVEQVQALNERMRPLRRAEQYEFSDLEKERIALDTALEARAWSKLQRALRTYHRRRLTRVRQLVARSTMMAMPLSS